MVKKIRLNLSDYLIIELLRSRDLQSAVGNLTFFSTVTLPYSSPPRTMAHFVSPISIPMYFSLLNTITTSDG